MLNIKTNALTEKGALRPAVRTTIREAITDLQVVLANGTVATLKYMGDSNYYGAIAECEDGTVVYGKVELTITTNDYKAPTKKKAPAKEREVIEFE